MSEQTPRKQPTVPGDPASGVQGGGEALFSKHPASNPYTVADYATGFMMGLEDRGWTKLDRELEDDIRWEVESLWDKLDVDGMAVRIGSLERERDEARAQAEYYAAGLESLADELPEWEHQHADGETEDQSILERVITTVAEWRREKAKRKKAEARIAELEVLLRTTMREHSGACRRYDRAQAPCNCGASEWNARIEAALGKEAQT